MRVVGGRLKGRSLASPSSHDIRPTADRLRESIFNILAHAYGDPVDGARVLDLFAGTGALGLEALSRGAAFALFVDNCAEARGAAARQHRGAGRGGITKVFRRDATTLGAAHPIQPFTLVFSIRPMARGWRTGARLAARRRLAGRPARWWWWKRRRAAGIAARRDFEYCAARPRHPNC